MIYGYSQAFTFSAISAGVTEIAAHAYSYLLPPVSDGDVGDLLGAGRATIQHARRCWELSDRMRGVDMPVGLNPLSVNPGRTVNRLGAHTRT